MYAIDCTTRTTDHRFVIEGFATTGRCGRGRCVMIQRCYYPTIPRFEYDGQHFVNNVWLTWVWW